MADCVSCEIEDKGCLAQLKEVTKEENEKALVVVTQDGCGACDYLKETTENFKDVKIPMVEINVSKDGTCMKIADDMKICSTPTMVLFEKGREVQRVCFSGEPERDKEMVRKLGSGEAVEGPTPQCVPCEGSQAEGH